ncbi:hypothetical protein NUACC26_020470 [Scytonema sp. NUACC26]
MVGWVEERNPTFHRIIEERNPTFHRIIKYYFVLPNPYNIFGTLRFILQIISQ